MVAHADDSPVIAQIVSSTIMPRPLVSLFSLSQKNRSTFHDYIRYFVSLADKYKKCSNTINRCLTVTRYIYLSCPAFLFVEICYQPVNIYIHIYIYKLIPVSLHPSRPYTRTWTHKCVKPFFLRVARFLSMGMHRFRFDRRCIGASKIG